MEKKEMLFKENSPLYSIEVERKQGEEVLYINFMGAGFVPSIAESPEIMARTIDFLVENPSIVKIVFVQQRNYYYSFEQVGMMQEIARIYKFLVKQEAILSPSKLAFFGEVREVYSEISSLLMLLRQDPVACNSRIRRRAVQLREQLKLDEQNSQLRNYVLFLERFSNMLSTTKLIMQWEERGSLTGREFYNLIFRPDVLPNFTFTRLVSQFPRDSELIDQYLLKSENEEITVTILKKKNDVKYFYHLLPPEYTLSEEHHMLLHLSRNVLIEHRPKAEEFTDPDKTRQIFSNVARDLLSELAQSKKIALSNRELMKLSNILVRYTIGFGLIELLLLDGKIQDIVLNAPIAQNPIYLRHEKYDECVTNIIPSYEDAESWAAKLRLQSGRPLDEAHPVLDTDLVFGEIRARVAAVKEPLSPSGLSYAFRRHRDQPWTLPLFIQRRMLNSFAAGLLSFFIDGNRTLLVAGTRSSGKTSLLGSLMLDILPKVRTIVVEDTLELSVDAMRKLGYDILRMKVRSALVSGTTEIEAAEGIRTSLRLGDSALIIGEVRSSIRGDQEVLIVENGVNKRVRIEELENRDVTKILVPTINFDLKTRLLPLGAFIKHPSRKRLLEVKTKTGRKVTVTYDHSLFAPTKDFRIIPIECKDLKIGNQIVIPSSIPCGFNDLNEINLVDELDDLRVENFEQPIRAAISKVGWKKATKICNVNCGDIYNYFRRDQKTDIPINSFKKLMNETKTSFNAGQLLIKKGTSTTLPALIQVNEDFCSYLGYFISEGYYEDDVGGRVIITNSDERVLDHISYLSRKLFDLIPKRREVFGAGRSIQLGVSCKPLVVLLQKFGCGRTCDKKRIPSFIYGLSKKKISAFLRTLYEGDGSITTSSRSGNSVRYSTTSEKLAEDVAYLLMVFGIVARIYPARRKKRDNQLWIVEFKDRKMVETFMKEIGFVFKNKELNIKGCAHTKVNTVYFDKDILKQHLLKYPRRYRHLFRFLRCSKNYLEKIVNDSSCKVSNRLKIFAEGNFYLDEIIEIKEIDLGKPEPVYDLSVSPTQNFIGGFGGILLHNTEAKALYEAMRVGALANVVAGTIHGDSPYGVFDRVVHDLEVPVTSFKATDIIIIANPVKTSDGLHSVRRVISVTEVRKHWVNDPLQERGFVDLLKYNVEKDELEPTAELINGESEVIKSIASQVKGWAGNWDAVYDNIILRGKSKQELVDVAERLGKPEILEAEFSSRAQVMLHIIIEKFRDEKSISFGERVFLEWRKWLMDEARKI